MYLGTDESSEVLWGPYLMGTPIPVRGIGITRY